MEQEKNLPVQKVEKNLEPVSFFENDADFVFAFKKTEKLVSAIYMVTGLFSENEPMKWALRKKASDLLSFTATYKDTNEHRGADFVYTLKSQVLEVVSFLEVCFRGGMVSEMNLSILKQEFVSVVSVFESGVSRTRVSHRTVITPSYLKVDPVVKDKRSYTEEIKDSVPVETNFKRSNRQNIILGLLKKKKELTINDIAEVIKDCSEKTIQRELISFIAAGVIKRTGERRWSKYSLK